MMAMVFAMTALTVACGKDDDATTVVTYPAEQPHTAPASVNVSYFAKVNPEMLAYLDLTLDYIGHDGEVNNLPLANVMHDTVLTWKATMSSPLPATLGIRLRGQLKDDIDTTDIPGTHLNVNCAVFCDYFLLDSNQVQIRAKEVRHPKSLSIPKHNLIKWLEKYSEDIVSAGAIIDAQGKDSTKYSWPL